MVNVFGDNVGSVSGNLQMVKKFVTTVGQFKDCYAEIQQSYVLGFTPYRLHTNVDGTFITPNYWGFVSAASRKYEISIDSYLNLSNQKLIFVNTNTNTNYNASGRLSFLQES